MTLPWSGQMQMDMINAEFGRGLSLGNYAGTVWWRDDGTSGVFSSTNLGMAEFYGTRATNPIAITEFNGLGGYNTTGGTTQTASNVNFGTDAPDRLIVVTGECHSGTTNNPGASITSASIAGVPATVHCFDGNGSSTNAWAGTAFVISALVPNGASGNVVITFSGTRGAGYIDAYRLRGRNIVAVNQTTQSTTGTSGVPFNFNIAAGSVTLAGAFSGANTTSYTWVNMTRQSDVDRTTVRASGAYYFNGDGPAGTLTVTSGVQGLRATAIACFAST